jgi:uncharacterized DUF497 family protein
LGREPPLSRSTACARNSVNGSSAFGHFETFAVAQIRAAVDLSYIRIYNKLCPLVSTREKTSGTLPSAGLSFALVEEFEWDSALVVEDVRRDYGERRFQALGMITGRLHALVFTPRVGRVHVISLRKANPREIRLYEAQAR